MIKKYKLFLDESGQFTGSKTETDDSRSSIVAGLLIENYDEKKYDENWAQRLLEKVKGKSPSFRRIRINPYHGMEEKDPNNGEFAYQVLKEMLSNPNIKLINFKNAMRNYVIDSNRTYLMVFCEGVIKLLTDLLSSSEDDIDLEILYAARQNLNQFNGLETNAFSQIDIKEYKRRLEERFQQEFMLLPEAKRLRVVNRNLSPDSGTGSRILNLADVVCFGLRGGMMPDPEGIIRIPPRFQELIKKLDVCEYKVGENSKWSKLNQLLIEDKISEVILYWYTDEDTLPEGPLQEFLPKFEEKLLGKIKQRSFDMKIVFQALSNYLKNKIRNGENEPAKNLIKRLEEEFCNFLAANQLGYKAFLFDLYFHDITRCSHEGLDGEASNLIAKAEELLHSEKLFECKDIPYLTSYKHRKVENFINLFQAEAAIGEIEQLIASEQQYAEYAAMFDSVVVRNSELGKLYGTYIRIVSYFYGNDEVYVEQAKEYLEEALANFAKDARTDISRAYLNGCNLYCALQNQDKAQEYLALALNCDNSPEAIAEAIKKETKNDYYLMSYMHVMGLGKNNAKALFQAYKKYNLYENVKDLRRGHPKYAILLLLARSIRNYFAEDPKSIFEQAAEIALEDENKYPIYCAGLAALAEQALLLKGGKRKESVQAALEHIVNFLQKNQEFNGWLPMDYESVLSLPTAEQEAWLQQFAAKVPII